MNNDQNNDYHSSDPSDTNSVGSGRGFASMDPDKQRKIAKKGGISAHKKGKAHEWNSSEAKRAGKLGGKARSRNSTDDNSESY